MGIRCWKFTDGETVAAKLVRGCGKWSLKSKDMETTQRMEVDWQWKWQGNWEVLREWTAKLLSGSWIWERKSENEKSRKYFENPGQVD